MASAVFDKQGSDGWEGRRLERLATGFVSPVKFDSSIRKSEDSIMRRSAGTRSPRER